VAFVHAHRFSATCSEYVLKKLARPLLRMDFHISWSVGNVCNLSLIMIVLVISFSRCKIPLCFLHVLKLFFVQSTFFDHCCPLVTRLPIDEGNVISCDLHDNVIVMYTIVGCGGQVVKSREFQ